MSQSTLEHHLNLDDAELAALRNLVEQALSDVRSESRRTEAPNYRDFVHQQQELLEGLAGKLRATA
jgi:hypothetical protein